VTRYIIGSYQTTLMLTGVSSSLSPAGGLDCLTLGHCSLKQCSLHRQLCGLLSVKYCYCFCCFITSTPPNGLSV